ncbi:MAG: NfeD family protein, partial [Candidatus Sumerlaeaceae bacterium]|nr:NfeD family protein [Candidatus Sumerlaeaceae bacterium]
VGKMTSHGLPAWVIWLVFGLVLCLAEIFVPSFFVIWFGLAAVVVSILLMIGALSLPAQLILWIAMSVLFFGIFRYFYSPKRGVMPVGTATGDVVGQVGVLVSEVSPVDRGRVRFQKPVLGSDEWPCIANELIPAGARVKVTSVEGQLVRVEREIEIS